MLLCNSDKALSRGSKGSVPGVAEIMTKPSEMGLATRRGYASHGVVFIETQLKCPVVGRQHLMKGPASFLCILSVARVSSASVSRLQCGF